MAVASKQNKTNTDQLKVTPALTLYQQQGCTLTALKQALAHGIDNKEKDLTRTFQKQLFQAAGQDQYRLHLHGQNELTAALNLSLALVDKNDNAPDWLDLLEQPDYWNAIRLTGISTLLNKAVSRLATHIPKARNPANEGAPRFAKVQCNDPYAISAGEATLAIATIEGDATLVGARFFFEFVFYLDQTPTSVLDMLLNKDIRLSTFLKDIGLDETTTNAWHSAVKQTPKQLSPLHAQLLLDNAAGEWLSITPILSVAVSSWLGQWRKERLYDEGISYESTRPLFAIESAEYGGTNARNIASIMMDFSGRQHHPKILPPPVKRDAQDRLARLIYRPVSLINPKKLYGKSLKDLSNDYSNLPTQQRTQKLVGIVRNLLEDILEDISMFRSLMDSNQDESLAFQNSLNEAPTTHRNLRFALGEADKQQIEEIADRIAYKWLGSIEQFDGTRYNKIKELVAGQLYAYMTGGNKA